MHPLDLAAIADVIGADPPPGVAGVRVTSVEFDSRRVRPGALFVALHGQRVDGHDFADDAARAGAVAVLGSRPIAGDGPGARLPLLARADDDAVLLALRAIAQVSVSHLIDAGLTVIGVTGSAGKTSTKDLIAAVLARRGEVVAPPESFNNELGHPYTVLRATADTDYLVLELSARGIGHIASLAAVAPPRIGAVLNVGSAHLGEFGSRDAIATAKGELVEALPPAADGGVAILNADDARVAAMASRTAAAVVRFGYGDDAEIRAVGVSLDDAARAAFTLRTPEGSAPVRLRLVGAHQVANALAAAAVGRAVGLDLTEVARALSAAEPTSKWRMAVTALPGDVTVINDAYNANPESVRAALAALVSTGSRGRRWAVLGEMAELGSAADDEHRGIGRAAAAADAAVLAVGAEARPVADAAGDGARWVPDIDAAVELLRREVRPGDVVLVKASRAVGLERLAARLIDTLPSVLPGRTPAGDRTGEERP